MLVEKWWFYHGTNVKKNHLPTKSKPMMWILTLALSLNKSPPKRPVHVIFHVRFKNHVNNIYIHICNNIECCTNNNHILSTPFAHLILQHLFVSTSCFPWTRATTKSFTMPCTWCLGMKPNIHTHTWRIIPVRKRVVTPICKPFRPRPFGRGTTLLRGLINDGY